MPKDKTKWKARNELPLEKRFQIVEEYENSKGLTGVRKLAEKFSCGKTQVSNILKQKTLVREEYERGFSSTKKRNRTSQYSDVNDAVWEWFKKKTEQRTPVDGPIIQEFAMKAAEKLGYPEFKASSGWLTRFKERNNLSQHKLCGESADVPEATVYSWKERLGSIISGYAMQDIWNMDETGCFYRALPDKSLSEKAKKCKGGKKSKERSTVAFFVSATGERRKPYILHKLLSQLNSSFKAQNRSILLFIDSAGCHPYDLKGRYSNIKLVFFPVNCTSKLQPLDLGIIQNFKVHYRKLLLRHIITMTTDHDSATDIAKTLDVLQAIRWMGLLGLRSRTIPLSNVLQQLEFPALSQKQLPSVL